MRLAKLVLVAAMIAAPAITFAQTTARPEQPNHPIVKRAFNQQRRIGNGIRNGSLAPRQGARLERQQMRIHRQVRTMRARHNGHLSMQQRRTIHRRQNIASRRIYRAKHMHRNG